MDKDINVKLGAVGTNADTSLDLPPQIEALLNMGGPQQPMTNSVPSYEVGGMVQPAGVQPMGAQPMGAQSGPMNGQMMEMQINQMAAQNPEVVARIRAAIEAGLQAGELSMEELNMAIELAKTVLQNPEMYPQVRQFAIQKGLAGEGDLSVEYDEGIVVALLMAAKSMATDIEFEGQQSAQEVQEMQAGGVLEGPSHDDGGIPVKVAGSGRAEMEGGEYVIPKSVVMAKGTDFFDKMLASYEDKPDAS
tara:strand:+ start:2233 stop:2976 length:744 start_codon:yes stop_codon:yes gene_type:complete